MKQLTLVSFLLLIGLGGLKAQNISINEDGTAPDGSAMLDVVATDKGVLIPRMTQAQRTGIGNPATSLIVYQTDGDTGFYFNAGTPGTPSWVKLVSDDDLGEPVGIQDIDGDTKIDVEGAGDDDVIRFDVGGVERFRMNEGRLEIFNTNNIIVGPNAGLNFDPTGTGANPNVAIGYDAMRTNVTGLNVVAVGGLALKDATGGDNTAVGSYALTNLSTGIRNVGLGTSSLEKNLGGDHNVAIGWRALQNNVSGTNNVAIGKSSGGDNLGSSNVFIGYESGLFETSSNKLYIENSNSSTPLIYGDFDNDSLKVYGTLSVDSAKDGSGYTLPGADGISGDILQTDGNGNVSWAAVIGGSSSDLIEDGDSDTKVQVEESANEDIIRFDLAGTEYLNLESGRINILNTGRSIFLGNLAGLNDDLGSNRNVFIGDSAGLSNTNGGSNIFIGVGSGKSANDVANVAIGDRALKDLSSGFGNTAIGTYTMLAGSGNSNVAVGEEAAYARTGSENIALGSGALGGYTTTGGSRNIALGFQAGQDNPGSDNIMIGYQIGAFENFSNQLWLGNNSSFEPLIWGDFDNDTVRVNAYLETNEAFAVTSEVNGLGIGRSAPSGNTRLDIYRSINNAEVLLESGGDNDVLYNLKSLNEHWSVGVTGSTKAFRINDHGRSLNRLIIDQSGNVGIGTTSPSSKLDVDGDIEIDANGSTGDDAFYFGDPDTNGSWRIKRDGNDLSFERREGGTWVFKMKLNP